MKFAWNRAARWIAAGMCWVVLLCSLEVTVTAQDPSDGIEILDAKGDDYGAGKVKYPSDKLFAAGTLDITAFRATPYSGGVQFQIDFAARVPRPPEDRKISNARYLRELQNNGLFLQNVDIYIDQDGRPDSGQTMTIPGRNADIAPGSGWEKAVILTPQPEAAASILKMADSKLAENVLFPNDPQLRGKTLLVDVPEEWIGHFDPRWGYVVVVTGASFDESFRMLDPNIRGFGKSIFARIVRPSRDDEYLGGGDHDGLNTNIIDIVLPEAMNQKDMLTPDHDKEQWAQLEAVFPNGRPPVGPWLASNPTAMPSAVPAVAEPTGNTPEPVEAHDLSASAAVPAPTGPPASAESPGPLPSLSGSVVDFDTGIVVISLGKSSGLHVGRIGRVLDENGQTLVKFVVSELLTDFSVCKIIEGDETKLRQGLKVELKSGGEG